MSTKQKTARIDGDVAPDLSLDEFQEMQKPKRQPPAKKTTAKSNAHKPAPDELKRMVRAAKASPTKPVKLPRNFEQMVTEHRIKDGTPLNWDARITDYYLNDQDIKDVRDLKDEEGKSLFTETDGGRVAHIIGDFKVAEVGALRTKDKRGGETTRRIVKVSPVK